MRSLLSAASSALLIAFGLFSGTAVTQTGSSFRVNSRDAVSGVTVELKEKAGKEVVARATTDADGKFTFRGLPEGKYTLTMTLPEEMARTAGASKPTVLKCHLNLKQGGGGPVKRDLDFKAETPNPTAIKKVPGKPKAGEITLTRAFYEFEGGGVIEGVITVR